MDKPMLGRRFLVAAGAAAVAAPMGGNALAGPRAAATIQTANQTRLFVGCCAYSYFKYFNAGSMTMESFIHRAVELEVYGVDITTYWLKSVEPEYLVSLRHLAFKNGVRASSRWRYRRAGDRVGSGNDEACVRLCGQEGRYSGNRKPRRHDCSSGDNFENSPAGGFPVRRN